MSENEIDFISSNYLPVGWFQHLRRVVIFLLTLLTTSVFAQKVKTVEGVYTYHAPENVTMEQARRTALDRAKIQAIADEFGTLVQQTNTTRIQNTNGESTTNFYSIGGSEVKGEWLETVGQPEYTITYEDNMLVVACKVKGKAREIVTAQIDFQARVLRNGIEDKFEDDEFKNGDDLYLSFLSPLKGYLAVYLIDAENKAYCLLPYRSQTEGIYSIDANRRYLFFQIKGAPVEERPYVDEYVMTCERSSEHNLIYIIFSPNQFAKAADSVSDNLLPRELSFENFQEWLAKCRKFDKEMNLRRIPITIKK